MGRAWVARDTMLYVSSTEEFWSVVLWNGSLYKYVHYISANVIVYM